MRRYRACARWRRAAFVAWRSGGARWGLGAGQRALRGGWGGGGEITDPRKPRKAGGGCGTRHQRGSRQVDEQTLAAACGTGCCNGLTGWQGRATAGLRAATGAAGPWWPAHCCGAAGVLALRHGWDSILLRTICIDLLQDVQGLCAFPLRPHLRPPAWPPDAAQSLGRCLVLGLHRLHQLRCRGQR